MTTLRHSELTEKIIGVFYDVYNELGYGFLESVYENSMMVALAAEGLACQQQVSLEVNFRGSIVGDFRADILVDSKVILELKAASKIADAHIAQTINYLKACNKDLALILNFGPKPEFKRIVL